MAALTTLTENIGVDVDRVAAQPLNGITGVVVRKITIGSYLAAAQAVATVDIVCSSIRLFSTLPMHFVNEGDPRYIYRLAVVQRALGNFGKATVRQCQNLIQW